MESRQDAVGDHTEMHAPMSRLSAAGQQAQLLSDAGAVERHGARFPRLFRPPYGMWNATTLKLLRRDRMPTAGRLNTSQPTGPSRWSSRDSSMIRRLDLPGTYRA